MVLFFVLAVAALAPALLLVVYFHRRDVYPEPPAVLWRTFGLGIVIVVPVCLVAWPLDSWASQLGHPLAYGFASAFLGAAIPEEIFKFLVVWYYAARHIHFDEPMDGIVYGATASLGFAALENVLYVSEGGLPVAVLRAVLAVPGHAFLGVIMGYYVARAKFTEGSRRPLLVRALVYPILLHGIYNTPLLASGQFENPESAGCFVMALLPLAPAIVVLEAVWALRLVRRLRAEQLAEGCPPVSKTGPVVVVPQPPTAPDTKASQAPGKWMSWSLTLFGGLLACVGALFTLGLAVAMVTEESSAQELIELAIGGAILGLAPLLLGIFCFFRGIRRLNAA